MINFKHIKDELNAQVTSTDPKNTEKLESLNYQLKSIWELEKTYTETKKAELELQYFKKSRKQELNKFLIGVIAPLVTAVALIFTLGFQYYQSTLNKKSELEANEATEWRSLVSKLDSINRQNLTIPTLLKSFFSSPKYGIPSREIASLLLPRVADEKVFQLIFPDFMSKIDWANFKDLSNLLSGLYQEYLFDQKELDIDSVTYKNYIRNYQSGYRAYLEKMGKSPDCIPTPVVPSTISNALERDNHYSGERFKEIIAAGNAMVTFLKAFPRPAKSNLSLKGCYFYNDDMSGIDFSKANFEDAVLNSCKFDNCILDSIAYGSSTWSHTAWWRAKSLNNDFIKAVSAVSPYDPSDSYYENSNDDSLQYAKCINKAK